MRQSRELMPFDPGSLMHRMFRDFDRLFEGGGFPFAHSFRKEMGEFPWSPQLEVAERDHHLVAKFDLPGVKKDEISVEFCDGGLTVSGERKHESEERRDDWFRSERTYGSFSRTIPLPEGVKPDDVKATFTNGVLELTMPLPAKLEGPTTTRIAVGEGPPEKQAVKAAA